MADTREIGLRVGAAYNQASNVATALVATSQLGASPAEVATYMDELAGELLTKMNDAQAAEASANGFPGSTVSAIKAGVNAEYAGEEHRAPAAPRTYTPSAPTTQITSVASNETAFSGSNRPLKLNEHPELPGWLHAQAAAKGVTEVWDNRGKPNYVAAIASGAAKTPPPFRSSNEGNDTSFWPPKG